MIWIRLSGGLGNQLFQWAAAEEVRWKTHQDIQFYTHDLKNYAVPRAFLFNRLVGDLYATGCPSWMIRLFLRYRITKLFPVLFPWDINKNNISALRVRAWYVLDDYFQNTLPIKSGMELVATKIADFAFRDCKITGLFEKLLDGKQNKEVAAVHIRRSDYLTRANRKIFYLQGADYYSSACEKLDKGIKQLFIFSDANREELPAFRDRKITYMKPLGFSDLEEFLLLSLFSSIIIANSTFSFWAALISRGNEDKRMKIGPANWLLDKEGNTTWNNNLLNAGFMIL
jgi:hypothetical protein